MAKEAGGFNRQPSHAAAGDNFYNIINRQRRGATLTPGLW
jgi:hypothetical protein